MFWNRIPGKLKKNIKEVVRFVGRFDTPVESFHNDSGACAQNILTAHNLPGTYTDRIEANMDL